MTFFSLQAKISLLSIAFACLLAPAVAQVEVLGMDATARRVDPRMVGYNSDYYYVSNPWSGAKRREAARKARPSVLRYPGGTSSSYWDAYHARIFRDVATIDPADSNPAGWIQTRFTVNWISNSFFWTNSTPLSDFKSLYNDFSATLGDPFGTIFVANMITPGADFYSLRSKKEQDRNPGAADWWAALSDRYGKLQYMLTDATKNGIPVRYVELGNEYYFGAGMTRTGKPADVEPYSAGAYDADNKNAYLNIGTFPDRDAAGRDSLYLYSVAANDWGDKIKRAYSGAKVCAVGAFVDKEGQENRTKNWNVSALAALDAKKVDAISLHLYGGPTSGSLIGTETEFAKAVTGWRDFWIAGRDRSQLAKMQKFDWWVTEFNIGDEFGRAANLPDDRGTWGNGLGNLFCVNYWLAHEPNVQIVMLHELARVIIKDGPDIKANARAYGLFAHGTKNRTRARALTLKNAPPLSGPDKTLPGIAAWLFDAPDDKTMKPSYVLVNFTDNAQTLNGLTKLPGATNALYLQSAAALNATADPGEKSGLIAASKPFLLPPYSVTVITANEK